MIFDRIDPRKVFWISVTLMVVGILLPLVMVLRLLDGILYTYPNVYFIINVFAFVCQLLGFLLGVASAAFYIKRRRK